jgi:Kef-type K+ transport system membrane component KefB
VFNLAFVAVFVGLMLFVVRPLLARLKGPEGTELTRGGVAATLVFMAASAFVTEVMGLHALFGAFLAGVVMPEGKAFREDLAKRAGSFGTLLLLPLFFAFSGLRTRLGLLDDPASWIAVLGIIGIAVAGKLGGCMTAARMTGLGWNDSFSLGALMNTRGLVELVALNIGYDLGILPPRIFTMMVLMALTTTFMTGPLLSLAARLRKPVPLDKDALAELSTTK